MNASNPISALNPAVPNPQSETSPPATSVNPQAETSSSTAADNPQSEIHNPQSDPLNPEPQTLNPALPSPEPPAPDGYGRPGRPRFLDDAMCREVCALISAGCGVERAAEYVGCAPNTIRREAIRNPEFNAALRRAHLAAELSPLNAMREAARKYWRAAAWLLERTNPQRFARQKPNIITPEQLDEFASTLVDIIHNETADDDMRERIVRRFDAVIRQMRRNFLATKADPCPKPRRPRNAG